MHVAPGGLLSFRALDHTKQGKAAMIAEAEIALDIHHRDDCMAPAVLGYQGDAGPHGVRWFAEHDARAGDADFAG